MSVARRPVRGSDADYQWSVFLTFALGSVLLVLSSGKVVSTIAYAAFVLSTVLLPIAKRRISVTLYAVCLVLMLSPADLQVRKTGQFGVRFVPVVYDLGASQKKREMERSGMRENTDFVVIEYQTPFMITFYSLTLFY